METKLSIKELITFYDEKYFKNSDLLTLKSIMTANHDPHQYVVGPAHVTYAAEHNGGQLTKDVLNKLRCAYLGCQLIYDEHKCDTLLFVQLKRETTEKELSDFLKTITDDMKIHNIDGFTFVDTPERYRIKSK